MRSRPRRPFEFHFGTIFQPVGGTSLQRSLNVQMFAGFGLGLCLKVMIVENLCRVWTHRTLQVFSLQFPSFTPHTAWQPIHHTYWQQFAQQHRLHRLVENVALESTSRVCLYLWGRVRLCTLGKKCFGEYQTQLLGKVTGRRWIGMDSTRLHYRLKCNPIRMAKKVILLGISTCGNESGPRTLTSPYEDRVLGNCIVCSLTSHGFTSLRYILKVHQWQIYK